MSEETPKRIPFDTWINSHLSIARHYGACKINGRDYELDFENCKVELDDDGEEVFKPDLVRVDENYEHINPITTIEV